MNPILYIEDLAEMLRCSVQIVEDCARSGRLPSVKFGHQWIFPTEAFMEAINRMAVEEAAERAKVAAQQKAGELPGKRGRKAKGTDVDGL